ncbi:GlsB/YeaQ/YmgE family stress response membrane protein [Dactylosporangium sp. CS-033363]|uniref:GlsB/YeaQ/YmgE family stress response membrane protein n=1 Tax=Dactylosporangium sp. CS-033363 TaxID=3239935 RepID=UPI003D8D34E0
MQFQDYLAAIVFGAVIGIVARIILPGRQSIGIILTVLIGMGAAVAGTWAADRWDLHSDKHFTVSGHNYDWLVVGVQVGIAVVGVGLAAALTSMFRSDRDDDRHRHYHDRDRY